MKINLLPPEYRRTKPGLVRSKFILFWTSICLFLLTSVYTVIQWNNVNMLEAEYSTLHSQRMLLEKQQDVVNQLQQELRQYEMELTYYQQLTKLVTGEKLSKLEVINDSVPRRLWLDQIVLSGNQGQLRGYSQDMTQVTNLLRQLNNRELKTKLATLDTTSPVVRFVIDVNWGQ